MRHLTLGLLLVVAFSSACGSKGRPGESTTDSGSADGSAPPMSDASAEAGGNESGAMDASVDSGPSLGGVGAACSGSAGCASRVCIPSVDYFPGGYCSAACTTNASCGAGGVCNETLFIDSTSGLPQPICLLGCGATSACRSGYFCDTSHGPGVCLPQDCRRSAAVCPQGMQCNQQTGACTASPLPTGYPGPFPAPPQVQKQGGPVLANPTLVPMFFSNDNDPTAPVADITAFFQALGETNYWRTLEEYGVGAPAAVVPVMLGQAAPASLDDSTATSALKVLLEGFIANGTGGTPAPGTDTLYVLVFPTGTTITRDGSTACTGLYGYHDEAALSDGTSVPYAVLPRCPGSSQGFPGDLPLLTGVASHEIAEGSTDPFVRTAPAWLEVDDTHLYFAEANFGAEIADMCENDPEAFYVFGDLGFFVQRIWSNSAALAGLDPCVPAFQGETFFNSAPLLDGTTSFPYDGTNATAAAVDIPMGQSGTVSIELYSDGPTTPWTVTVEDYACLASSASGPLLSFTLAPGPGGATCGPVTNPPSSCVTETCTGSNGDTVQATITVLGQGGSANQQVSGTELFLVESSQGSGDNTVAHLWWGLVGN
jgi:hypothetical protein